MSKISLIGAGAWGLAIANVIASNDNKISVYSNEEDVTEEVNKYHTTHRLPAVKLSNNIYAEQDLASAVKGSDFIFIVTPSIVVKEILQEIQKNQISKECIIITCSKGIDEENLQLFSQLVEDLFPENHHAVLSGPNFAIEVAKKLPSVTTIACANYEIATKIKKLMHSDYFLPIISKDVISAQICGIVKNIFAIGCGVIDGLKLGENAKAALLVRGVEEMNNLIEKLGGNKK